MKKLYRFNEFLSESGSVGDFSQNLVKGMDNVQKVVDEELKKIEREKDEPTFEFKDNPLKKDDVRKDWVKKIQDVFVNKKIQEKVDSKNYGSFGSKTETAVKAYQKSKRLNETGEVDNELMKLILKDLGDIEKEKNNTPFENAEEGNAFRVWVIKKDAPYASSIKLSETGEYNNSTIQGAWKKYGEQYKKEKGTK